MTDTPKTAPEDHAVAPQGELPPLPEKVVIDTHLPTGVCIRGYTADQMRAYARAALASQPLSEQQSLRDRLQQKCSDWKAYWRAPDAHGVVLTSDQALELLGDALGVEVEIVATLSASPVAMPEEQKAQAVAPHAVTAAPISSYSVEDREFFSFWYGHMKADVMQSPLGDIRHATARYIWDAARAASGAEPVAWLYHDAPSLDALRSDELGIMYSVMLTLKREQFRRNETPLYASPVARQPLTEEEIVDIWAAVSIDYDDQINIIELARAIERKLRGT